MEIPKDTLAMMIAYDHIKDLEDACKKWAEVSQENYQRAKKAEAMVSRLIPIALHYGGLTQNQSDTIKEAKKMVGAE